MQEVVKAYLEEGMLLAPDLLNEDKEQLAKALSVLGEVRPVVCSLQFYEEQIKPLYNNKTETKNSSSGNIQILTSYDEKNVKISMNDFVNLYNTRYSILQSILRQRQELSASISISKINTL